MTKKGSDILFPPYYYEYRKKRKQKRRIICAIILVSVLLILIVWITSAQKPITEVSRIARTQKLSKTATLQLETLYSCGHKQNRLLPLPEELHGKTETETRMIHPDWNILRFEEQIVVAEEKLELECNAHLLLTLIKNKIIVTRKNTPEEIIMEEEIDLSLLTKEDQEILSSGISVNSEYELLEILESFR